MLQASDIEREVRRLASEHPDAVYVPPAGTSTCSYTEGVCGGGCGCIVGQAVQALDPTYFDNHRHQDRTATQLKDIKGDMRWCQWVQRYQDGGHSWGTSVKLADKGANR